MLVLQLPMDAASLLGPHRMQAGWEVCQDLKENTLWLRCPDGARNATAALPCTARYRTDHAGRLIPWTGTLPVAKMPAGPWEALNVWLVAGAPPLSLPGRGQSRVDIRLERSSRERTPSALLLDLDSLLAWAETASRLRLSGLNFAASASGGGRALVTGTPLPPVPGTACYFHGRLTLPCGWDFPPPLWPAWVEQCLSLPQEALALLDPSGRVEILEQEGFMPLTLAAVRRTLGALPPPCTRL
jgi:hypothetical protein